MTAVAYYYHVIEFSSWKYRCIPQLFCLARNNDITVSASALTFLCFLSDKFIPADVCRYKALNVYSHQQPSVSSPDRITHRYSGYWVTQCTLLYRVHCFNDGNNLVSLRCLLLAQHATVFPCIYIYSVIFLCMQLTVLYRKVNVLLFSSFS